jgi:hypothetical protein
MYIYIYKYLATKMTDPIKIVTTGQAYIQIITDIRSSTSKIDKNATVLHIVSLTIKDYLNQVLPPGHLTTPL